MWKWFVAQYNDIKGNFKWALLAAMWWLVVTFGKRMLQLIPNISGGAVTAILLCLSLAVFLWLAKALKMPRQISPTSLQPSRQPSPSSFPSLSSLSGQTPNVTFNAREWFRYAYYSPLTAEIENNIKIAAEQNQPGDHESFYARFIGVGLVGYMHDITWAYIFKSQLWLLMELNRKNLPIADAKAYYDKAVAEYPQVYKNYPFQDWLNYMESQQLIIRHPSDMLEITHKGKDLLRYLAHWGRDANAKVG